MTKLGRAVFALTLSLVSLALITLLLMLFVNRHAVEGGSSALTPSATSSDQQVTILVDDFEPQPMQGKDFWWYNRLGGDRGPIRCSDPPTATVTWGRGLVTATITTSTNTCAGVWTALNHPLPDHNAIDFSAIFPPQIKPEFQGQITDLQIDVVTGTGVLSVELKAYDPVQSEEVLKWSERVTLTNESRNLQFNLPSTLTEIQNLNWQLIGSDGGFVVVDRVALTATVPYTDTPQRAFLWSYAMLLANWDPESGLTRDHAHFLANERDNISASGLQAAAAVMAWRLGFTSEISATEIVSKTAQALLDLLRDENCWCYDPLNRGSRLWPHFYGQITDEEWSSIDTVIAVVALLEAQDALGLDTTEVEAVLRDINWDELILPYNHISHGYWSDCESIENCGKDGVGGWKDFGTESWVVNLGYAAATGNVVEFDHTPPTANGGGFIDELAWLLMPPCCCDQWGTEWCDYSQEAADCQLAYYRCREAAGCCHDDHQCRYPEAAGCLCCRDHPYYDRLGLFGLTPNEPPDLTIFPPCATRFYLDFGVCGEYSCIDGTTAVSVCTPITSTMIVSAGHAVIVPHYAGVIASLRPTRAISLWNWLEAEGLFTPLNNVESLMCTDETTCEPIVWNERKGSWEIGLQTLGWGRLLAEDNNPLYQGFLANDMLRRGYMIMCPPRIFLPIILKEYQ